MSEKPLKTAKNIKNSHFRHFREFLHSQTVRFRKSASFDRSKKVSKKCQFWTKWYYGPAAVFKRSLVNGPAPLIRAPGCTRATGYGVVVPGVWGMVTWCGSWCTTVVWVRAPFYRVSLVFKAFSWKNLIFRHFREKPHFLDIFRKYLNFRHFREIPQF